MRRVVICSLGFVALTAGNAVADAFDEAVKCHSQLEMGAFEAAIASCEAALEAATLSEENAAVTLNNLGRARLKLGEAKVAERDFSRALEADPAYAPAYNNRAIARAEQGDAENALMDFDKAIEIDAEYVSAHFNRSRLRLTSGDPYGALEDVSFVLSQDQGFDAAIALRSDVLATLGLPNSDVATADVAAQPKPAAAPAPEKQIDEQKPEQVAIVAPAPAVVQEPAPQEPAEAAAPKPAAVETAMPSDEAAEIAPPMPDMMAAPAAISGEADMAAPQLNMGSGNAARRLAAVAPIDRPLLDMAPLAAMKLPDMPLSPVDMYADLEIRSATPDAAPTAELAEEDDLATAMVAPRRTAPTGPAVDAPAPVAVISMEPDRATVDQYEEAFRKGRLSVATIQKTLAKLGYRPGPVDGLYGRRTREALAACLDEACPLPR